MIYGQPAGDAVAAVDLAAAALATAAAARAETIAAERALFPAAVYGFLSIFVAARFSRSAKEMEVEFYTLKCLQLHLKVLKPRGKSFNN